MRVWEFVMTVFQRFKFGFEAKNDYDFGSVCHSNEMHSSFETGDHLKLLGLHWSLPRRALKKMREPLGETAIR